MLTALRPERAINRFHVRKDVAPLKLDGPVGSDVVAAWKRGIVLEHRR